VSVLQSLKWIFWGVLIAAIPIQFRGYDLKVLGYAIIAAGMIELVNNAVSRRYDLLIKVVAIVALLDAFWAPFAEGAGRMPSIEKTVAVALDILNVFAAIGFCIAMRRLCAAIPLERAERTWRRNLALWCIGAPASVAGTCLSFWAARNENGVISPAHTSRYLMIPLFILFIITAVVWIHFLVSLWRTIAGLQGMVKKLPAASDFGLDQQRPLHFQFSIRALMIVTAAVAVVAAGFSQGTILYWQLTMAGLVALGLLAMWLNHRTLSKGLLMVVGVVLLGGFMQITHHGAAGGIGGFVVQTVASSEDHLSSEPIQADIEAWLAGRGFTKSEVPSDSPRLLPLSAGRSLSTIWYAKRTPKSQEIDVSIECSPIAEHLLQVQVTYSWRFEEFPWVIREHERQANQFTKEMADWLREYEEGLQKKNSKP
jgi:hypothetical protein